MRALAALAVVAGLAGCTAILAPDDNFEPAVLVSGGQGPIIAVPDTVQREVPFVVAIRTFGGGCVDKGDMRVDLDGGVLRLRPFDLHRDLASCTDDVRVYEHRATLAVNERREYTVRIEGWAQPADTAVVFTQTLVVR